MMEFSSLIQQGAAHAWLFVPTAILLGVLHGLEPGHSKTMMAAFIVAIRGTVSQAVMLGLAATLSHTAVVWAIALLGLHFGSQWDAEATEPYFQVGSAVLIIGIALWMIMRTRRDSRHAHDHDHDHHHDHEEIKLIETPAGQVELTIVETNCPPHFQLRMLGELKQGSAPIIVETERADGSRQRFALRQNGNVWESIDEIPEPHEFIARLEWAEDGKTGVYDVEFTEHGHDHAISEYGSLDLTAPGYQDPHELAHANDIRRRFANRAVTNGQIIMFGLTGGLIPCPAAITVLLLCLQLKELTLGATLVLCFSIGLALTMVLSGTLAAISVKHASKRWSGFGELARKAPYFSSFLIIGLGLYVGYQGLHTLIAGPPL